MLTETINISGCDATYCRKDNLSKYPSVLFIHGFASNKDEVANTYKTLSKKLSAKGISSLRFTLRGFEENSDYSEKITLDSMMIDVLNAYNFLKSQMQVDPRKILLCGFSMGAFLAIKLSEFTNQNCGLVLISPVKNFYNDLKTFLLPNKADSELLGEKDSLVKIPAFSEGKPVTLSLKTNFFYSIYKQSIEQYLINYQNPVYLIAGEKDFSARNIYEYKKLLPQSETLILKNADHIFNAFEENSSISIATEKILRWIEKLFILQTGDTDHV